MVPNVGATAPGVVFVTTQVAYASASQVTMERCARLRQHSTKEGSTEPQLLSLFVVSNVSAVIRNIM